MYKLFLIGTADVQIILHQNLSYYNMLFLSPVFASIGELFLFTLLLGFYVQNRLSWLTKLAFSTLISLADTKAVKCTIKLQ